MLMAFSSNPVPFYLKFKHHKCCIYKISFTGTGSNLISIALVLFKLVMCQPGL